MKTISQKKKLGFKEALKQLAPAYIISSVFCYMLFVFEPLLMYSTNMYDFWFDFGTMLPPVLVGFGLALAAMLLVVTAVYFISRIFSEKPKVYYNVTIVIFFVFLVLYIQGNILTKNLPALDGRLNWNNINTLIDDIVSIIVADVIAAVLFLCIAKLGLSKMVKYLSYASLAVFFMLTSALVMEMITWNAIKPKDNGITTANNFNEISDDKNFIILLTDSVGSVEFNDILEENPEYKKVFEDFTYYPDTLGCFPCTRDTIPVILGGAVNKNEMKFTVFSSNALNESPFFKELSEKNYEINLFESELMWFGSKSYSVANSVYYKKLPLTMFWREEIKYVAFKYLPYCCKRFSNIETMNFNKLEDKFAWDDPIIYNDIIENPELSKSDHKSFRFIHAEGAHIPFKYDKNLNLIGGGNYEMAIEATITMLDAYIERLKANGSYDNSVIIILSDHGNSDLDDMLVRANPMFMMKGIDERHTFARSDKPLSYTDLMEIYSKLLDGKTAEEAAADIPDSRERFFMWYDNFKHENHMEEYVVTDKASEWTKFKKTGRVFDLSV